MNRKLLFGACIFFSAGSFSQVESGLVAKYSFNTGTAVDEVGINDGTVSGASLTADRFGNVDYAYYFDGISDYVDLGSSATIKPATGSISLWFNIDAISTSGSGFAYNPLILSKNDMAGSSYFEGYAMYVVNADNKVVTVTTESQTTNQVYIFSDNAFANDTWQHVVMCYDDDSLWFYSNGILDDKILKGFVTTLDATIPVLIAKSGDVMNDRYFNGGIDDVRIYDRVLNATEVDSLFNEQDPLLGVGINDAAALGFQIYPNPATTELTIVSEVPTEFRIVDMQGIVIDIGIVQQSAAIDISFLANGIYFIQTQNGHAAKLIKQ